MANARVVDMATFLRMRERGERAGKISKWLGVSQASAVMLLAGTHWQQDPVRIALFNEYRGTNLPVSGPEMGIAPADVIERFGGASGKRKVARAPGEQWTVDAVKRMGVHPEQAGEVARRMSALAGHDLPVGERVDTAYLLEATETKLAKFYRALDDEVIAGMSGPDLVKAIGAFIEKRALLRGEPTQIVSHRERAKLDAILPLLVEAAKKRGVVLDLTARVVEEADG